MEHLVVNRASGLPPYRQLSSHLGDLIRARHFRPGDRLPAVREMVHTYGLATNTVQKALRELKAQGMVVGRQGDGLFVSERAFQPATELPTELWIQPMRLSDEARAGVLNRFHARHPHARVVESAAGHDLRWIEQSFVEQQADVLEDVTDLTLDAYGRQEDSSIFDGLRVDGKLFMMPFSMNAQVMACNLELFERQGVALPSPDWDWAEFLRISTALTQPDRNVWGVVSYPHWDLFLPLVWQAGGAVYSADGRRCLLDSEAGMEAARHLRARGRTMMRLAGPTPAQVHDQFVQGRAAMTETGSWGYYDLTHGSCRWVARPLPRNRLRATWLSARGYGLSRRCPWQDMARQFLRECSAAPLGGAERQRVPALPLHRELESDGETERVYRESLRYGRLWLSDIHPRCRTAHHLSVLSLINRYMEPLLFGPGPVEPLIRDLAREMDGMLSSEEYASRH